MHKPALQWLVAFAEKAVKTRHIVYTDLDAGIQPAGCRKQKIILTRPIAVLASGVASAEFPHDMGLPTADR